MKLSTNNTSKGIMLSLIVIAAIFLASCDNNEKIKKDADDLNAYVKERRDSVDRYLDTKWEELDQSFENKREKLDKDTAKMGKEVRANYNKAVRDWEDFKNEYTTRMEEKKKIAEMDDIRGALTIEGVKNDYSDLGAANILQEYRHFVKTVETNKDNYTKEQWTVVNVSWKSLNGRRKEVSKDITKGDNGEITNLQLKYTGIKAINRPFAESEE